MSTLKNDLALFNELAEVLINEGHAVAYFGGAKEDIQKQHIKNRKRLVKEGLVEGPIQ